MRQHCHLNPDLGLQALFLSSMTWFRYHAKDKVPAHIEVLLCARCQVSNEDP